MKGKAEVFNGIDRVGAYDGLLKGGKLGLVTGPTGVDKRLVPTVEILRERYRLTALYAPEHGIWGDAQAGEHVPHAVDRRTGLPVYSLYGANRGLSEEIVRGVDIIVFDMQDVGVRYFTYLYTLANVMKDAARFGLPVLVLDRVNPLNGVTVNGTVLDERFASFVGQYAIPARYALTIGEFARFVNATRKFGCELTVAACAGWHREMYFDETDLIWVMPSPNLPTPDSALCYPGTCLFEGTNLSEGRGTTRPFELVGAPWVDPARLARQAARLGLEGVLFRPASFRPTFSKHAGCVCHGVQVHVTDRDAFDPFLTGLALLDLVRREYGEFELIRSETGGFFLDNLLGSDGFRAEGFDAGAFVAAGAARLDGCRRRMRDFLLY